MPVMRVSYTISPEVLLRFNEVVPASERSRTVQSLMESILKKREKDMSTKGHPLS